MTAMNQPEAQKTDLAVRKQAKERKIPKFKPRTTRFSGLETVAILWAIWALMSWIPSS